MTKTINDVIDFASNQAEKELGTVSAERITAGVAGQVAKEINTVTLNHYTEEEVCVILEGRVRLTDLAGNTKEFGTGSTFVLPAGFKGTWETLEPLKKIYVIWRTK